MKKLIALTLTLFSIVCACCGCGEEAEETKPNANETSAISVEDKLKAFANGADKYLFGTYEQDGKTENGKEDIEWIPFAMIGSNLVAMVSKYCIDIQPYVENQYANELGWADSDLILWLNTEFLNSAFSKEEQNYIAITGEDEQVKVSILDGQQISMLPEKNKSASMTEYVKSLSSEYPNSEAGSYWIMPNRLSFYGVVSDVACWINADGTEDVDYTGELSVKYRGVRPVIFVDISSVK